MGEVECLSKRANSGVHMRRRWRWPLADFLRDSDADEWIAMAFMWFVGFGAVTMITVAIWHPTGRQVAGSVPFWMAMVLAAPYVLAAVYGLIVLTCKLVPVLVPRRVIEPVTKDLRESED